MSTSIDIAELPREDISQTEGRDSLNESQNYPQEQSIYPNCPSEKESTLVNEPIFDSTAASDIDRNADTQGADINIESMSNLATGEKYQHESNEESKEKDVEYPSLWKLALITVGLSLCVFCVSLDNTIIATAIPKITDQFNSLDDVGWYASAYLLTTCSMALMFGKLYSFFSIKWIYLIALSIFEIGSLICGVTPNSVGLICGRAVAGLGAAGLMSGALLIISQSVPLDKRPIYTGLVGAMFGLASVAGPLMGGAFTDHLTWRWCFYINLPIGAVTFIFILICFKSPQAIKKKTGWKHLIHDFDLIGFAFFVPAIICVLLALQWGGTIYDWNNARIIALFIVFGVLIMIFWGQQYRAKDNATIPLRLMKNRNVWGSAWYALAIGGAFFIMVYYLPLWFQTIKGASALKSGIMNLPVILGVVIASLLAGGIITACGYYTPFMIISSILLTVGAGLLSTLEVDSGHPKWIGYQALLGLGLGLGMQQPMIVVQTALKAEDVPIGTAIIFFSQTLGGAIFVSVGQNVFQNQVIHNLAIYAPTANVTQLLSGGATAIRTMVSDALLESVILAYNAAITQVFYVAVAMGAMSLVGPVFIEWLSVKGKKIEMTAA